AAFVARSPCEGSRGSSTATRDTSSPFGNAPSTVSASSADRRTRRKSPKMFGISAAIRALGIDQAAVLGERDSAGHAGEVIGDDARPLGLAAAGLCAPFRRQMRGLGEKQPEQLADDAAGV